ncbi:MAG TPA: nicotinate (nicotinamide) nucleotide adenylyltransferase [Bacteroidales bacterium]|nr:nicotinate (nicotinamide) nucleotide adenylyltransferase [Bacteroidales bacterium]
MKAGLFFGSYNPIHIGHLAIANYMLEYSDLDELWLVISPQNPLKKKKTLLNEYDRFHMAELALEGNDKIKPSDIEFRLPKPSYTIDTLSYLKEKNPATDFVLIMGADNIESFEKWKNYETILKYYQLYVYPRPGYDLGKYYEHPGVKLINAPLMEISSSFIRDAIKQGKDVRYFLPEKVYDYICKMNLYKI